MPSEKAFEDIERDRASREAEVRLIERFYAQAEAQEERAMLARSLVLLAYAHLEGFTKSALTTYAEAINGLKLPCRDAALPLVAATLKRLFVALRDVNTKDPLFRDLPDDSELHLQWRHFTFIRDYDAVMTREVDIPDTAIDTGSNLSPKVLKRNLYQLGLNYPAIAEHQDTLSRLLGVRNQIAHGDHLTVPKPEDVEAYVATSFRIMAFVQAEVLSALETESYRRREQPQAA